MPRVGAPQDQPGQDPDAMQLSREDDLPNLKGVFPFRLGTTSFILPAPIEPNLRYLGPYLDEVELVLFESGREEDLPSRNEIDRILDLKRMTRLEINVHLPIDIHLGDAAEGVRRQSCETVLRYFRRTLPLNPTLYILHLSRGASDGEGPADLMAWRGRLRQSFADLRRGGLAPERIAVENLDYPFAWIHPLIQDLQAGICIDVGHLLLCGADPEEHLRLGGEAIRMLHLHGMVDGRDHRAVTAIPPEAWGAIKNFLRDYRQGVSLEVFSRQDLKDSLEMMKGLRLWQE